MLSTTTTLIVLLVLYLTSFQSDKLIVNDAAVRLGIVGREFSERHNYSNNILGNKSA